MRKPNLILAPYPDEDGTTLAKRLHKLMLKSGLYKEMKQRTSFTPRSQARRDEVPWVFLWQQHDLYGVANWIEWTPRADERVWMYEAKLAR